MRRKAPGGVRNEAKFGVWGLGRAGSVAWGGWSPAGCGGLRDGEVSELRNEPNWGVFRFGGIRYRRVGVGSVLAAKGLAALQFGEVGEEEPLGFDDVTVEALEGVGVGGEAGAEIGAHLGCVGDAGGAGDEGGGEG